MTLAALVLVVALAGCAPAEELPPAEEPAAEEPAGREPVDPGGDEPVPDETDPGDEATTLVGTFGGDAQLEGGCAWLDTEDDRFEILWPDGYQVEFEPLRLLGPDGEVVAEQGDTLAVRGREATDMATICQVGVPYQADDVERDARAN